MTSLELADLAISRRNCRTRFGDVCGLIRLDFLRGNGGKASYSVFYDLFTPVIMRSPIEDWIALSRGRLGEANKEQIHTLVRASDDKVS
jgi:hypothetical protein